MGLSRLSKKCRECKYVDTCNHKMMEALAYINEASIIAGANTAAAIVQPHNYRNKKIDFNTTITIDLEDIKREVEKSLYRNLYNLEGK